MPNPNSELLLMKNVVSPNLADKILLDNVKTMQ